MCQCLCFLFYLFFINFASSLSFWALFSPFTAFYVITPNRNAFNFKFFVFPSLSIQNLLRFFSFIYSTKRSLLCVKKIFFSNKHIHRGCYWSHYRTFVCGQLTHTIIRIADERREKTLFLLFLFQFCHKIDRYSRSERERECVSDLRRDDDVLAYRIYFILNSTHLVMNMYPTAHSQFDLEPQNRNEETATVAGAAAHTVIHTILCGLYTIVHIN